MKIFKHEIFAHRKIIFIFLLAIFLPSLVVGYLSLSTFSRRREAVKNLLESNLWISGEAALKSIEGALLDHEIKALKSENFDRLIRSKKAEQTFFSSSVLSKDIAGQLFLLDADYQIIFPETGSENTSVFQWEKEISNSQFAQFFREAESFEFSQKKYAQAAELYKKSISSAPSNRQKAIALEGFGRSLLSSKRYDEAYKVYNELSGNYGQFQNKAGHPYGIISVFQLFEINRHNKKEAKNLKTLLDLYEKILDGVWLLNTSNYDFFIAEIESILNSKFKEGKFSEIQKAYLDIRLKYYNHFHQRFENLSRTLLIDFPKLLVLSVFLENLYPSKIRHKKFVLTENPAEWHKKLVKNLFPG